MSYRKRNRYRKIGHSDFILAGRAFVRDVVEGLNKMDDTTQHNHKHGYDDTEAHALELIEQQHQTPTPWRYDRITHYIYDANDEPVLNCFGAIAGEGDVIGKIIKAVNASS